jgi:hypothetical protein
MKKNSEDEGHQAMRASLVREGNNLPLPWRMNPKHEIQADRLRNYNRDQAWIRCDSVDLTLFDLTMNLSE